MLLWNATFICFGTITTNGECTIVTVQTETNANRSQQLTSFALNMLFHYHQKHQIVLFAFSLKIENTIFQSENQKARPRLRDPRKQKPHRCAITVIAVAGQTSDSHLSERHTFESFSSNERCTAGAAKSHYLMMYGSCAFFLRPSAARILIRLF